MSNIDEEINILNSLDDEFYPRYEENDLISDDILKKLFRHSKKPLNSNFYNGILRDIHTYLVNQENDFLDEDDALDLKIAIANYQLQLSRIIYRLDYYGIKVGIQCLRMLSQHSPNDTQLKKSIPNEPSIEPSFQKNWIEPSIPELQKNFNHKAFLKTTKLLKELLELKELLKFDSNFLCLANWFLDDFLKCPNFQLSLSVPDHENPYPDIFEKGFGWAVFSNYVQNHKYGVSNAVFSYLFRQMLSDGYIRKRLSHIDFENWIWDVYKIRLSRIKTMREIGLENYATFYLETCQSQMTKPLFQDND
ncbi:hypothetical protein [Arcticibacterium luteifluviistationis]|uniref:Uncharacterized protein n=1 Tax=Arcticibacterium luteifluviistationis TaxID=1784714 RepID=A0A2Z4G6F0_9BACT|nr:hypothetical protein [Arcticibacterium luteifluviistationis]AWV96712.1 hypothetical protein DJ013_00295 [Arcticibacterium luteifluviistationis]